jgi:hypothetical protein
MQMQGIYDTNNGQMLITSERFDVWNRDWHHSIAQKILVGVVVQHFLLGSIVYEILGRIHEENSTFLQ